MENENRNADERNIAPHQTKRKRNENQRTRASDWQLRIGGNKKRKKNNKKNVEKKRKEKKENDGRREVAVTRKKEKERIKQENVQIFVQFIDF